MGLPDRDIAQAKGFIAPPGYSRHRPETTLLYQLVAQHYSRFRDRRAAEERPLPRYVDDADHTCNNWTSSDEGSAMLGHHDRYGGGNVSWNAAHPSVGCSQEALVQTGGAGLLYCFAAD